MRNPDTFLYNTGPVTRLGDADLNVVQTYDLVESEARRRCTLRSPTGLYTAPANVGTASMPNYASLRTQATTRATGSRPSPARPTTRSSSTCASSTCCTAATSARSETTRWRATTSSRSPSRCPVPSSAARRTVIGVWSHDRRRRHRTGWLQPGLASRHAARQRGRHPAQGQGPVQRVRRPRGDAQFLKYVVKPELPKLLNAVYGLAVPKEPRNDLVQVFLTGVPGTQPAEERQAGRDAAAEPHAVHRSDAQPARRHRR